MEEILEIPSLENEEWRDVEGYEGLYMVSNFSRIKALKRVNVERYRKRDFRPERLLKPKPNVEIYHRVELSKNGVRKIVSVHRMVAKAFIPNPENKPNINHVNGIRNDNRLENLEWCTQKENIQHAHRTGLSKKVGSGCFHPASIPIMIIDLVKNSVTSIGSLKLAAKYLGVGRSTVCRYVNGQVVSKRYKFELIHE